MSFISHRLNTKNQVEPVIKGLDLQLNEPFLLYRNSKSNIYGIWFYDKEECVRIASMLTRLVKESENSDDDMDKKTTTQRGHNSVDIYSMLSRAQLDFNIHRSNASEKASEKVPDPLKSPLGPDIASKSVIDFFAKAKVRAGKRNIV